MSEKYLCVFSNELGLMISKCCKTNEVLNEETMKCDNFTQKTFSLDIYYYDLKIRNQNNFIYYENRNCYNKTLIPEFFIQDNNLLYTPQESDFLFLQEYCLEYFTLQDRIFAFRCLRSEDFNQKGFSQWLSIGR